MKEEKLELVSYVLAAVMFLALFGGVVALFWALAYRIFCRC